MIKNSSIYALAVLCLFALKPVQAQETPLNGEMIATTHRDVFNGVETTYRAIVDEIIITDGQDEAVATISSTAYVRENVRNRKKRPVVFIWNGGPSAASITFHMAGLGPKRLVVPDDVAAPVEPPYEIEDNAQTILDVADLVFVDPVETGLSRILPAGDRNYFYSARGDAESVAQYVEKWLEKNDRALSPTYVLGTSYGSIRAPLVAGVLARTDNPLKGVILISQGVNLVETTQRKRSLVGYASNLPQLAAIAHYHGMTEYQDMSVYDLIDLVYDYSFDTYLPALAAGRFLSEERKQNVAEQLSAFTGLNEEFITGTDLRFSKGDFRHQLLHEKNLVLASNDARYVISRDIENPVGNPPVQGAEAVHERYMKDALNAGAFVDAYRSFAPETENWDYVGSTTLGWRKVPIGSPRSVFADYDWTGELVAAFEANEDFRLLIATGVYDTLTTAGPARLLAADPDFAGKRVRLGEYEGGHSFYSNAAEFGRLADDIRSFLAE